jgi:exodeoxyribonuclease V alpha subunit
MDCSTSGLKYLMTSTDNTLEGTLERVIYYHKHTLFTVAHLKTVQVDSTVTVVGRLAGAAPGQVLKLRGHWDTHPRYGHQFKFQTAEILLPESADGICDYLASGIIRGVGPKMAQRLVDHFGKDTLKVMEVEPQRLLEVEGIGENKAKQMADAWREQHGFKKLLDFLQAQGVRLSYASKIFQLFGPDAVSILKHDPYRLADDLPGIGFLVADRIAINQGGMKDDPDRIQACLCHQVEQFISEGHVFAEANKLLERCCRNFEIEWDAAQLSLDTLMDTELVTVEPLGNNTFDGITAVYPKVLHAAEVGVANKLLAHLSVPLAPPDVNTEDIRAAVLKRLAIKLSTEQLKVLEELLVHRVIIITGGAGTGKTTLIRSITAIFENLYRKIRLTAPTGRAARRLGEVTRREAATIHKLLGFNPSEEQFKYSYRNPLDVDVLIIDEASMVDTLLMYHLLNALPMKAVLILVGDVFQLPSVGPGNVLADLICSGRVPSYELTEIFRQTHQSSIVIGAHRIRQGRMPAMDETCKWEARPEFCFIEEINPSAVLEKIVALCCHIIPHHYHMDPIQDIQVLTPMHKGVVGTIHLNQVLQKQLQPEGPAIEYGGVAFKPGDKVMHMRNNYHKEVFNGDIGIVAGIDNRKKRLVVNFDGRLVDYEQMDLEELSLAYAISVHKSQGSEYPAIVVPLTMQHYVLLQRNLLYTAVTRGKFVVVMVGTRQALSIALKNDRPQQRLTRLSDRLRLNTQ